MEMPSQEEQIIAEEYVLERPLDRPDTDIKKAVKSVVVYLLSSLAMGFSMLYLFSWLGIFALFSDCICDFREQHSIWFSILFILLVYCWIVLLEESSNWVHQTLSALCTRTNQKALPFQTDLFRIRNIGDSEIWFDYWSY